MKFTETKENFKELGKDFKAIGAGIVGVVVGTFKIPVCLCKDFRDSYLKSKDKSESEPKIEEVTA